MIPAAGDRVAGWLLRRAAGRLGPGCADWSRAMRAEVDHLPAQGRLSWAAGAWLASWRTPEAADGLRYGLALAAGVCAMTLYQCCVDENPVTVALACGLVFALVLARPSRTWLPALSVGLVVFAVNLFGTLTGLRPAYETHAHTWLHDLRWALVAAPALAAAALGRLAAGRLAAPLPPETFP